MAASLSVASPALGGGAWSRRLGGQRGRPTATGVGLPWGLARNQLERGPVERAPPPTVRRQLQAALVLARGSSLPEAWRLLHGLGAHQRGRHECRCCRGNMVQDHGQEPALWQPESPCTAGRRTAGPGNLPGRCRYGALGWGSGESAVMALTPRALSAPRHRKELGSGRVVHIAGLTCLFGRVLQQAVCGGAAGQLRALCAGRSSGGVATALRQAAGGGGDARHARDFLPKGAARSSCPAAVPPGLRLRRTINAQRCSMTARMETLSGLPTGFPQGRVLDRRSVMEWGPWHRSAAAVAQSLPWPSAGDETAARRWARLLERSFDWLERPWMSAAGAASHLRPASNFATAGEGGLRAPQEAL